MDEDDRMVANVLMARGQRVGGMALAIGAGALVLAVVPHTGVALPARVYGICAVLPIVAGLAAVPGGLLALKTFSGHPPGVQMALKARGMAAVGVQAFAGMALGTVALVLGILSLMWLELG